MTKTVMDILSNDTGRGAFILGHLKHVFHISTIIEKIAKLPSMYHLICPGLS